MRSYGMRRGGVRTGRFRSALEARIAAALDSLRAPYGYEKKAVTFTHPARQGRYIADFILPNGIIVEAKGIFDTADRQKHILIRAQHPNLDIRFVFANPNLPIYPGSPTTCADWCKKNGFKWAAKLIPTEWLQEGHG